MQTFFSAGVTNNVGLFLALSQLMAEQTVCCKHQHASLLGFRTFEQHMFGFFDFWSGCVLACICCAVVCQGTCIAQCGRSSRLQRTLLYALAISSDKLSPTYYRSDAIAKRCNRYSSNDFCCIVAHRAPCAMRCSSIAMRSSSIA